MSSHSFLINCRFERSEASRCFNCSSYSHSLRECPKARDNAAISNARNLHSAMKTHNNNANGQTRYFLSSGKFGDLKAGVLESETRECLGIRVCSLHILLIDNYFL